MPNRAKDVTIETWVSAGKFHACPADDRRRWVQGKGEADAVGAVIRAYLGDVVGAAALRMLDDEAIGQAAIDGIIDRISVEFLPGVGQ